MSNVRCLFGILLARISHHFQHASRFFFEKPLPHWKFDATVVAGRPDKRSPLRWARERDDPSAPVPLFQGRSSGGPSRGLRCASARPGENGSPRQGHRNAHPCRVFLRVSHAGSAPEGAGQTARRGVHRSRDTPAALARTRLSDQSAEQPGAAQSQRPCQPCRNDAEKRPRREFGAISDGKILHFRKLPAKAAKADPKSSLVPRQNGDISN